MPGKSTYFNNMVLNGTMRSSSTAYVPPTANSIYMALCTTAPSAGSTGSTTVEATYTGYSRTQIVAGSMNASTTSSSSNSAPIQFNPCTASTSTILGFGIVDNSGAAGNLYYFGTITSKVIDQSNTPATVGTGALVITES